MIKENRRHRLLAVRGVMGNRLVSCTTGRIWLLRPAEAAVRPASAGEGRVCEASGRPGEGERGQDQGVPRGPGVAAWHEDGADAQVHACRLSRYDLVTNPLGLFNVFN
jgi:hypothetical protein